MTEKLKNEVREVIVNFSCGLLAGTIDVLLYFLFQSFNAGKYGYGSIAMRRAVEDSIDEVESLGIDGETVRKVMWRAIHRKKLIRRTDDGLLEVTQDGLKRLKEIIPSYRKKRPWNGHFYLVTYDIVEEKKRQRRILREYLKKLGCGMLQDSVWITPYNPKIVLKKFILDNNLSGSIVVSDIGKDGSIGDEALEDLVYRVYRLEEINKKYEDFISEHRDDDKGISRVYFQFLSILKDDPRLPFEILPQNWAGDKAHRLLLKKIPSQMIVLSDGNM